MISLTIDGQKILIEEGKTILDAARQAGVNIPTLCNDSRLKPTAACRICLVEVEKMRGPMPACNTTVTEGMVVKTTGPEILESRRSCLELMLSDHYGDCIAPCQTACPAHIDIQGQLAYIANGKYAEALQLIKETNPLPLVCGRVCPRFCEQKCRRNLLEGSLAINMLKRFVADIDMNSGKIYTAPVKIATGKKVAVIGGGPAGLTAAYYLALDGHAVSLFDASPRLGGMLRYGIPEYRLPKAVLDKEIAAITKLCKEVKLNVALGKDYTIESLKAQGFDAIFLGIGAWADQKMGVPGEDVPGVFSGIGFLHDVIEGKKITPGDKVVVVGGGNTAIDAARTALRLGAKEVTIVYRRSRAEMPANDEEVEGAEQEGVRFQFLAAPTRVEAPNGKASAIECIKMALGASDASGRRRPEPVKGSEFKIPVSAVIMAIGQSVDMSGLGKSPIASRCIIADSATGATIVEGVFSGGDCVTGPATAVEAIGAGRRAAEHISVYLATGKVTPIVRPYNSVKGENETIDVHDYDQIAKAPRAVMPAMKPEIRKANFKEIDLGISEEQAVKEANRCLSCGCLDVFECKLREYATEYKVDDKRYAGKKRHLPIKWTEHPKVLRDNNKCILCGRCVRICDEVDHRSVLGYVRRGIKATIEATMEMPLKDTDCDSCLLCISTCPTGALAEIVDLPKPGPFKPEVMKKINTINRTE
ncbi:MAG TPA: NAD(P)-binding protein [Dehalococcoidales bacterium]|nr:NAD(P)-binding protein [Dehalococcoidales bacterium]